MKKKILITGGAGFLGSYLCERLLNEGCQVFCLDDFSTGTKDNIRKLIANSNFEVLEQDVTVPLDIKVDQIYNLACPASPIQYQKNPIKTLKTSVLGAINMLEIAKKTNAKILQASTSEVYGDPLHHPQLENYWGNVNPIGERACYDEGKRCAETLFFDYFRVHKVDISVARIFNTYGPRMQLDDGRVVSNFIKQAIENKPITIYGDGSQTRSFCYVTDLIDGLIKLMEKQKFVGPVNLGNPNEFTVSELAKKIINLTKSNTTIEYKKLPSDDPKQRKPSIEIAEKKLKWKPGIELETGLIKTIEYIKNEIILQKSIR